MKNFISFLEKSPTANLAVEQLSKALNDNNFEELNESTSWNLEKGKNYYVVRDSTALIAFKIPNNYDRFHFIGAHTDSPNLRLRHVPDQKSENYNLHAVEIYGGVLLHTWIDRDLALAGKVIYKEGGELKELSVNINEPIFKIPSLAIHLQRNVNEEGLKLNKHKHFNAISGLIDLKNNSVTSIMAYVAEHYSIEVNQIKGFDLSLYDHNPPSIIGIKKEFISSPRLDNLAMCYASINALIKSTSINNISVATLFDHEEVGSESYVGAGGSFLNDALDRIKSSLDIENYHEMKSKSYFISADMAHALHPNFPEKHDSYEFPLINLGPVIKYNANERYSTNVSTEAYLIDLCEEEGIEYQKFTNRQDLGCGSTIGPAISTRLGIPTIDIGNPMLSMHSIRELCGVKDMETIDKLFGSFYSK